ncbi:MAG: type II toxin-antitoxin system VapC family toxin [Armatimonadetes bacterium]|nr:type II toxin-antitoxin system VapC family toxin [Armatimonadota bacterium]MDW8028387.1 type II toxin-antitoxin system VapC family toxin [Armatimonadota bacterium]
MKDLVDSPLFMDWIRGKSKAIQFFKQFRKRRLMASVITRAEVLAGMRPEESWRTQKLLRRVKWIPVTEEIADQAAAYMAQYSKTHGLTLADALIAATAKVMNARLVTLDRDFFPMTDLQVHVPY